MKKDILLLFFILGICFSANAQNKYISDLKNAANFGMLAGHDIILSQPLQNDTIQIGALDSVIIHPDSSALQFKIADRALVRQALQSFNQVFAELNIENGVILTNHNLSAVTFTPGVYHIPGNVTSDPDSPFYIEGGPDDIFIFDITGDLTISNHTNMGINGNVRPSNIFWVVGHDVIVGAHSTFIGNILSANDVTFQREVGGTHAILANGDIIVDHSLGFDHPIGSGGGGGGGITGYWDLKGNTGITAANYLGTSDNADVLIKTGATSQMRFNYLKGITTDMPLGITRGAPRAALDVDGSIILSDDGGFYYSSIVPGTIRFTGLDFEGYLNNNWISLTGKSYGQWIKNGSSIYEWGNVGIGISTPLNALSVNGYGQFGDAAGTNYIQLGYDGAQAIIESKGPGALGDGRLLLNYYSGHNVIIGNNSSGSLFVGKDLFVGGNVGIGTNHPDKKLTVKGGIHAESVTVDLNVPFPDYVFEKNYKLMSLHTLHQYIKENKHLPGMPSAKEMAEHQVMDLGEMNTKLLQKIEELTLYILELKNENIEIKSRLSHVEKNNKH